MKRLLERLEHIVVNRRLVLVSGAVQGVGFRPYVYKLARELGLGGSVRNRTDGVAIEVEGDPAALDRFVNDLTAKPPPHARIDCVHWLPQPARGDCTFQIETSDAEEIGLSYVPADLASCDACLAELANPGNRRYSYPFLNCTHCGPRLTIIEAMPYDRQRTTMAAFIMCPACAAEYAEPSNRRFHAQPTACPACGPRLTVCDKHGEAISCQDPVAFVAAAIRGGRIVAIKGLGGYHLSCAARDASAVAELRQRKGRDEKPFAVMAADLEAADQMCIISASERRLLCSPQRPIVLLRRRLGEWTAEGVAPGNPYLGVMLPYTPLHHVLFRELNDTALVMTSGNRTDEPIAYQDRDALERLAGIADLFLIHDRPIHLRCDDSVTRVVAGEELPLRRSRGYVPQPLHLPRECPCSTLALGGHLKATFALGQGRQAILSHHIGDLDQYEAYRAYSQAIEHYERLFKVVPQLIVHDLHPGYASTHYAQERARKTEVQHLAVQHHHAHLASCLAEHGLNEPVIGVIFDGTGLGTDGAVWGGEFLVGDYVGFRRAAHLRYVPMPGGEHAIREPWRMALAHLYDAEQELNLIVDCIETRTIDTLSRLIERRVNAPLTSSVGRLFDAVAALAGIRQCVTYEGQAAVELEWRASEEAPDVSYPFDLADGGMSPFQIDTRPLIAALASDVHNKLCPGRIARRFQSTLVEMIVVVCRRIRGQSGLDGIALSGGVFMNALLLTEAVERLSAHGFRVYRHRHVPPNDGGLCLGQLAIAAATVGDYGFCMARQGEVNVPGHPR